MTRYIATFSGKPYAFEESLDTIRIQTHSGQDLELTSSATPGLLGATLLMQSIETGMQSFTVDVKAQSLAERLHALRPRTDLKFSGSSFVIAGTATAVLVTDQIFVKFRDDVDEFSHRRAISDAGLVIGETISYARHGYYLVATAPLGVRIFEVAQRLLEREDVESCHPEVLFRQSSYGIHTNQWHLKKTMVSYPVEVDASANVEAAHTITRGAGTLIAVIDDGFDIDHPAFSEPGKIVAPYNADSSTNDPRPVDPGLHGDNHGTPCAGIACASASSDAVGVAPDAKLMPIRIDGKLKFPRIAAAFKWAADNGADVISCSWGNEAVEDKQDDPMALDRGPLPDDVRLAIKYAAHQGRGGKGCLIFFAAGNDNFSTESNAYLNCCDVLAVAACNDLNVRSSYSRYGKAIFCCFPSDDSEDAPHQTKGIWTVDRLAPNGYNPGHSYLGENPGQFGLVDKGGSYTASFGGTSASCPGAAGVAALVIAANPALTRLEVRNILKISCDKIDTARGNYDADGHSIFYGYGRLNAGAAVKLAKAWDKGLGQRCAVDSTAHQPCTAGAITVI